MDFHGALPCQNPASKAWEADRSNTAIIEKIRSAGIIGNSGIRGNERHLELIGRSSRSGEFLTISIWPSFPTVKRWSLSRIELPQQPCRGSVVGLLLQLPKHRTEFQFVNSKPVEFVTVAANPREEHKKLHLFVMIRADPTSQRLLPDWV